jgi:uncharacterized protein
MKTYSFRLKPKEDLKKKLYDFVEVHNIKAGFILTCVGSLEKINIRLSNLKIFTQIEFYEITSLVGTLCKDGLHLHIGVSDNTGKAFGGHLLNDCIIHTTAEIVIGIEDDICYKREYDNVTMFKELKIIKKTEYEI